MSALSVSFVWCAFIALTALIECFPLQQIQLNAVCKIDYLCVSSRSLANIVPYIYVLAISVQDLQVMLLYEFEEAQVLSANGDLLLSLSFSKLFVLKTRKVIFYMPKGKYIPRTSVNRFFTKTQHVRLNNWPADQQGRSFKSFESGRNIYTF